MSTIPDAMRRNDRPTVPHFDPREYLYRRIPLALWPDAATPIEVNAVALPDLSVGRSKFGHPEWLRVGGDYENWGVIGFQVQYVPVERWVDGVFHYTFLVIHVPRKHNYPHSEVQCFQNGEHVDAEENLPEEMHIEWRELLLRNIEVFLKPQQTATIRQTAPASHKPESPIPP